MDIVIKNVLDAIHYVLEHNEFKFTEKQLERADEFITPFIKELNISEKEFIVKTVGSPKLAYDKRTIPLLVKYFAYIEDNIPLYEELLNDGYVFYENYSIKFFALDRIMTGNFKKNEYRILLSKYEAPISRFYFTLKGLPKEEKEKYSKDFSDIVHIDQTTLKVGYHGYDEMNHFNYLTKKNIEFFGKDFLLKIDNDKRKIINNIKINMSEEEAIKVKELLTKYPNYSGLVDLNDVLLKNFSIDEINVMSRKDSVLYDVAIKNNLLDRMIQILKINPDFNCPSSFIKTEIFRILSNEEIVELSEDAKIKISESIPDMDNVIVMPIKKIRRIVFKDKMMKKIDYVVGNRKK